MSDSPGNEFPKSNSPANPSIAVAVAAYGAPPVESNRRVVKAVLITIAVFVGLGVVAVAGVGFSVWYFARSMQRVPSATLTEADLGIAIYPGAEPSLTGARGEMFGKPFVSATYFTRDSEDKVIAFYKEKAGPNARFATTAHGSTFHLSPSMGGTTTVVIARIQGSSGGMTHIHISHSAAAGSH